MVDKKSNYEIIEVLFDTPEVTDKTLGFDIGNNFGDYSIIADTAVIPLWHPPDFDDYNDIKELLRKLNINCLFSIYSLAQKYLETYNNKTWGEKDDFDIIQLKNV